MSAPANAPGPDAGIQDLYWCGVSPDGAKIYGSAREAAAFNTQRGFAEIVRLSVVYPHEMAHLAALGVTAGLCWYFAQSR
jgi:hypothetical protein